MGHRPPRSTPNIQQIPRTMRLPTPSALQVKEHLEPTHSLPVVIPPRTPTRSRTPAAVAAAPAKATTAAQTVRTRGLNGGRPQHASKKHNPDAIPPAVAALLAVTSIPKMPSRRRKGTVMDKKISMDELIQEWRQDDLELSIVGSPLDLLLGRVDESEEEYGSPGDSAPSITSRSISSDSLSLSTIPPSLDHDAPSFTSNWDALSTPESYRRSSFERREKMVSSPPAEDCVSDHPLLGFSPDDSDEFVDMEIPEIDTPPAAPSERFRSFKSNLTASFQALKSAAKSFSNFTAPSLPPDDLLTRSLLSPRFTSEMRPKHMPGLPSAELRRYLNPPTTPVSPADLSTQLHEALMLDVEDDVSAAPMIQMQTYERRNRASDRRRKSTQDATSDADRTQPSNPAVRQREPRENSDFLRVIVLEMNMRRVGKLDARAIGKARIWLPPRKINGSKLPSAAGNDHDSRVPNRWVAVLADEA